MMKLKLSNNTSRKTRSMNHLSRHVCICTACGRQGGCKHSSYVHIKNADLEYLRDKYKSKIMGRFRFKLYLRRKSKSMKYCNE